MLQFKEMFDVIKYFRDQGCNDMFVIYTGYYPYEITEELNKLSQNFNNIIIKFKFIQLGIEPAISVTPTLLTFESGSTTPQNVIVDSTDSWTAK